MDEDRLDEVRRRVLDRIDRHDRWLIGLFAAGIVIEANLIFYGAIRLADFRNPTHALIFLSMLATYVFLALGLCALGLHVSRIGRSILKALELQCAPETCDSGPHRWLTKRE